MLLRGEADQIVELDLGEIYLLLDVEHAAQLGRYDTHAYDLALAVRERDGIGEEVAIRRFAMQRVDVNAEAAQELLDGGAQRVERHGRGLAVPRRGGVGTRDGDAHTVTLAVTVERVVGLDALVVVVAVAHLVEFQIAVAVVDVELHGLERIEQKRLTQYVQVGAQGVEYAYAG